MLHSHSHGGDASVPLLTEEHGHGDGSGGHGAHGHGEKGHGGHGGHGGTGHAEHGSAHAEHGHGGGGGDHGHGHGCGHGHGGDHSESSSDVKKMKNAIYFAVFFMLVEIFGGVFANSLAIITDAAHMLSDVGGFIVSLLALKLSEMEATKEYSFGFQQADILGALFSIMIVWALTAVLLAEAVPRLIEPQEVEAGTMLIIAVIGFIVNLILMKVLGHGHSHDEGGHGHSHGEGGHEEENSAAIQAALAHVIGDIVQSLGVCLAAVLMKYQPFDIGCVETSKGCVSKWYYADPACTFLFGVLVLNTTRATTKRTVNTLMARAPESINQEKLIADLSAIPAVDSIHDLHVWSLGSKEVLCTAHLLIHGHECTDVLKGAIKVAQKHGVGHSTFQIEVVGEFDPATEEYGTLHKHPSRKDLDSSTSSAHGQSHGDGHAHEHGGAGHGGDDCCGGHGEGGHSGHGGHGSHGGHGDHGGGGHSH